MGLCRLPGIRTGIARGWCGLSSFRRCPLSPPDMCPRWLTAWASADSCASRAANTGAGGFQEELAACDGAAAVCEEAEVSREEGDRARQHQRRLVGRAVRPKPGPPGGRVRVISRSRPLLGSSSAAEQKVGDPWPLLPQLCGLMRCCCWLLVQQLHHPDRRAHREERKSTPQSASRQPSHQEHHACRLYSRGRQHQQITYPVARDCFHLLSSVAADAATVHGPNFPS